MCRVEFAARRHRSGSTLLRRATSSDCLRASRTLTLVAHAQRSQPHKYQPGSKNEDRLEDSQEPSCRPGTQGGDIIRSGPLSWKSRSLCDLEAHVEAVQALRSYSASLDTNLSYPTGAFPSPLHHEVNRPCSTLFDESNRSLSVSTSYTSCFNV